MPGLVVAQRRWNLSSDDLPIPALLESAIRGTWLIALAISYWNLPQFDEQCSSLARLLLTYLVGLQLLQIMILSINTTLIHLALQGTVLCDTPRAGVVPLIYFRTILFVPEIGWHILGAVWLCLIRDPSLVPLSCNLGTTQNAVQAMINLGVATTVVLLIGVLIVFDPAGSIKHLPSKNSPVDEESGRLFVNPTMKGERTLYRCWRTRIRLLFCCVWFDTGSREAYRDVAELFSGWFHDIDVVPSDLLCALILLRRKQSQLRKLTGNTIVGPTKFPLSPFLETPFPIVTLQPQMVPAASPWMTPRNALHFMRFAWGSYGWPTFMLTHACTGLCTLWSGLRCCSCIRPFCRSSTSSESAFNPALMLRGDNCCECHTATVRTLARIPDKDLLIVSFKNSLYKIPFFVCYDHEKQSVVVVIRGTLSVNDVLTDFTGDSTQIDALGVPRGSLCHKGFLKCARYILNKLSENQVLEAAFKMHPSYRLVLTGHSLGGGVSVTLGLLLRGRYPSVRCFVYSPPGGTFSRELCRLTETFALSVVVGDDVVPRLGISQLDELKRQMLTCLVENTRPKHEILSQGLCTFFCKSRNWRDRPRMTGSPTAKYKDVRQQKTDEILGKLDTHGLVSASVPSTNFMSHRPPFNRDEALENKEKLESAVRAALGTMTEHKLWPPGKILYLIDSHDGFEPWWAPAEHFNHVIISPHMLTDHLPGVCYRALKHICERTSGFEQL
ncbi:sn1-specific diacylglycerol lipase beta-like isoform X1 [Varroa jacobsoni]|uniref:sn1-specific diacylglycerol lipase beta-like isoform X1 n=1 Tax=Varroa jacobsoni TaxID=62625 RepID=UPI000BFA3D04|nr:sn1-specific diacylglycerol lipase beta-like isoform X1 [Varroa jacobsoni]